MATLQEAAKQLIAHLPDQATLDNLLSACHAPSRYRDFN